MALGKSSDLWKDVENYLSFKSILDLEYFSHSCSRILKSVNEYGDFDTIEPAVRYYRAYKENKTSFEEFSIKYDDTNYQNTCIGVSITTLNKIVQDLEEEYPGVSKAMYLVSSIWDSRQMSEEGFRDVALPEDAHISLLRSHCALALKFTLNGRDGYVFLETTWYNTEAVVLMKDQLLPKRSTCCLPVLDFNVSHYLQDDNDFIVQFLENKAKQRFYSGSIYLKRAVVKPDMISKYYALSFVALTHIFLRVTRTPSFYVCVLLNTKKRECKIEINESNEATRKMLIPSEYFCKSENDPAIEDFLREAAFKLQGRNHYDLKLQLTDLCRSQSDTKLIRDTKSFLKSIEPTFADTEME